MSGRTTSGSTTSGHHLLYAYWRALVPLVVVFVILFVCSFLVRGGIIDTVLEQILVPESGLSRSVENDLLSEVLGYDVGGSVPEQFASFLSTHGGFPLIAFLVVGGMLAVAFEWRYGALLE